jgi:hypothetical protein
MAKKRHLHDRKRFLAPQGRSGDGHGYLTQPQRPYPEHADADELYREAERVAAASAMCDEPEALSLEEWSAHIDERAKEFAKQQQKFEDAQREQARRLLTFEERLDVVTAAARQARHRVDITRDLALLRHMAQSGKGVRHLERRLFLIERKVFSKPDAEAA